MLTKVSSQYLHIVHMTNGQRAIDYIRKKRKEIRLIFILKIFKFRLSVERFKVKIHI